MLELDLTISSELPPNAYSRVQSHYCPTQNLLQAGFLPWANLSLSTKTTWRFRTPPPSPYRCLTKHGHPIYMAHSIVGLDLKPSTNSSFQVRGGLRLRGAPGRGPLLHKGNTKRGPLFLKKNVGGPWLQPLQHPP